MLIPALLNVEPTTDLERFRHRTHLPPNHHARRRARLPLQARCALYQDKVEERKTLPMPCRFIYSSRGGEQLNMPEIPT